LYFVVNIDLYWNDLREYDIRELYNRYSLYSIAFFLFATNNLIENESAIGIKVFLGYVGYSLLGFHQYSSNDEINNITYFNGTFYSIGLVSFLIFEIIYSMLFLWQSTNIIVNIVVVLFYSFITTYFLAPTFIGSTAYYIFYTNSNIIECFIGIYTHLIYIHLTIARYFIGNQYLLDNSIYSSYIFSLIILGLSNHLL
jgi:hypothetical protein